MMHDSQPAQIGISDPFSLESILEQSDILPPISLLRQNESQVKSTKLHIRLKHLITKQRLLSLTNKFLKLLWIKSQVALRTSKHRSKS